MTGSRVTRGSRTKPGATRQEFGLKISPGACKLTTVYFSLFSPMRDFSFLVDSKHIQTSLRQNLSRFPPFASAVKILQKLELIPPESKDFLIVMLVFNWDNQIHKALVRPNVGITLRDGNSVKSSHFSVVLQRHLEVRVLNLDSTPMTRADYIAPSEVPLCKVWIILCSSDARLTLKPAQTQKKRTIFFFFISNILYANN